MKPLSQFKPKFTPKFGYLRMQQQRGLVLFLALVALGMIFTLQQFDLIASMTDGGPVNSTNVLQYWSWQFSIQSFNLSLGSAVSALLLVVVAGIATIYVIATRSEEN